MLEFESEAIVLNARPHGESGAIVHVLTEQHGVFAAHVAGGASRRLKAVLQTGSAVVFRYRARSFEQLGSATLEPASIAGHSHDLLDDPVGLLGLQCACAMTQLVLPEREAHEGAFHGLTAFIGALAHPSVWPAVYVRYEAGLLDALGFGLDLSACAVTGVRDQLVYVSPKSGRAVSLDAGAPYKDKLLSLPSFLVARGELREGDVVKGLSLTGYFLERNVFHPHNKPLPDIRQRLIYSLTNARLG